MSENVSYEFRSLQRVRIKEIDAFGFVTSRMNNAESQNEYQVTFWLDGKRTKEWFFEGELENCA